MPTYRRTGTRRVDADGVLEERTAPRSRVAIASGVLLVLAAGIAWLALRPGEGSRSAPRPQSASSAPADPTAPGAVVPEAAAPVAAVPPAGAPPAAAPPAATSAGAAPATAASAAAGAPAATGGTEAAERAPEATGVAVFPPLGTKPVLRGILVPEGFDLPPGYVRHYQTTDDGEMLPAILLFHPDRAPLASDGRPLTAAKDRVVPPEQAPPGMPLEYLDPPSPEPRP